MRPIPLQILNKCVLVAAVALGTAACTQLPTRAEKTSDKIIRKSANQRVFQYPYDSVWRASQLALKYPIAVNNMDNGTLETEWVKAIDGFQAPTAEKEPSSGIRYKISLTLVKGRLDGKESVRVTMNKRVEKQRDFFSDPEAIESDGLEEKILFYRIEREVVIDEGLKKATANSNK